MTKKATMYRFEQLADTRTTKLYIYDDVTAYGQLNWDTWQYDESETSCKYFRDQLAGIPDDGEIELHVNSCGGSVKEGIAIYNLLKQHKAHKTCYVDGFAHSIASVICLACDRIIMGEGTSMLIHNMAMEVYGNAEQLRKYADDLDTLMESNRQIYMTRAKNLTEEELTEMMNAETFLTPDQCLEYGFCDEISGRAIDEPTLNQQAMKQIRELKEQLTGMRSLRQEMLAMAAAQQKSDPAADPKPDPLSQQNKSNEKVLKMARAFFNAFSEGGKEV